MYVRKQCLRVIRNSQHRWSSSHSNENEGSDNGSGNGRRTKWKEQAFEYLKGIGISLTAATGSYFSYCNWWNEEFGPNTDYSLDQAYLKVLSQQHHWSDVEGTVTREHDEEQSIKLQHLLQERGMILVVGEHSCGKTTLIAKVLSCLPGLQPSDQGKGIIQVSITLRKLEGGHAEDVLKEAIFNKFQDAKSNARASGDLTDFLSRANELCKRQYGHKLIIYLTLDINRTALSSERCQDIAGSLASLGRIQDYDRGTCKLLVEISDTIEKYHGDVTNIIRVPGISETDFFRICEARKPEYLETIGKEAILHFHNTLGGRFRNFSRSLEDYSTTEEFLAGMRFVI